jgi:hypothetical protein
MLTVEQVFWAFQVATLVGVFAWSIEDGMILSKYRQWLERKKFEWNNGEFWTKPLGLCSFCFSFWVSLLFALFLGLCPIQILLFCAMVMYFDKLRTNFLQ